MVLVCEKFPSNHRSISEKLERYRSTTRGSTTDLIEHNIQYIGAEDLYPDLVTILEG